MIKSFVLLTLCLVTLFTFFGASEARMPRRDGLYSIRHKLYRLEKKLNALSDAIVVGPNEWCPPQMDTKSDAEITALIAAFKNEPCLDGQLRLLNKFINADSSSFTGAQVLKIVPQFSEFVFVQSAVIDMLRPKISGLFLTEAIELLSKLATPAEKLKLLEALKNTIYEVIQHKAALVSLFSSPADKAQAEQILVDAKGRNCVFGSVEEPEVSFVVDVSGSMEIVFETPDGTQYTRLQYVKEQLIKLLSGLKPHQRFNIYTFSGPVFNWVQSPVQATPENIEKAIAYVKTITTVWKGTNISDAIQAAFKNGTPELKAIYLLSDGSPNAGITDVNRMMSTITTWNNARQTPVVINSVSFSLGYYLPSQPQYSETAGEKKHAASFMKVVAEATGGMYKVFNDGTSRP